MFTVFFTYFFFEYTKYKDFNILKNKYSLSKYVFKLKFIVEVACILLTSKPNRKCLNIMFGYMYNVFKYLISIITSLAG